MTTDAAGASPVDQPVRRTTAEALDGFLRSVPTVQQRQRIEREVELMLAAERERCAKLCESLLGLGYRDDGSDAWAGHDNALRSVAALIRAA